MKRWCVVLVVFLLGLLGAGLPAAENGFDGAQIQKFIDEAVERGGGEVVLPPGVHELRQSLVIPAHVRLRLVGLEAEQVWLTVAEGVEVDFPLLVVEAGDAVVAPDEDGKKAEGGRILVEKLTFKTQAAGETAVVVGEGEGVPLLRVDVGSGAGRVEVRRCFFERHGGHGVVLAAGNREFVLTKLYRSA